MVDLACAPAFAPAVRTDPRVDWRGSIRGAQLLPFVVRPMQAEQLGAVRELRYVAYRRHGYSPGTCDLALAPDALEATGNTTTLVATDKRSGEVLGTLRLICNLDGPVPLPLTVPADTLFAEPFAYLDRLAVVRAPGAAAVTFALMKASWLWTAARGATWMVAGARRSLVRRYEMAGLFLRESSRDGYLVPACPGERLYLVAATVAGARSAVSVRNPSFRQFITVVHPDIRLW